MRLQIVRRGVVGLVMCGVAFGGPVPGSAQTPAAVPPASFETVNVCERVTGESVAKAVAGKLLDVRPINVKGFVAARCIYRVEIDGAPHPFVLWLNPASDYEGLRKAASGPIKTVTGIGAAAHLTLDEGTKRYTLTAVKPGQVTIQVTGGQVDWVQTLARLAMSKF
jgi:hypothetical protein